MYNSATMNNRLKKMTEAQVEELVKMYQSGLGMVPLAKFFNMSRTGIYDLLKRRVKMRPRAQFGAYNHFFRGGVRASDRCHNVLETAIGQGVVERRTSCEKCGFSGEFKDGRSSTHAHHCDYNKPLKVMWLCQKCHHEWHKKNKAIPFDDPSSRS